MGELKGVGKAGANVAVTFVVREAGKKGMPPAAAPLLEKERLEPLPFEKGDKVLSPSERGGGARLPPLPKDDDDHHFQAAATMAKDYLEHHQLLPFVRALPQT